MFLNDLVSISPKYHHNDCGKFYTFGWCGEREMSFVALLKNMGFSAKVVAKGIHAWTEVIVELCHSKQIQWSMIMMMDRYFNTRSFLLHLSYPSH